MGGRLGGAVAAGCLLPAVALAAPAAASPVPALDASQVTFVPLGSTTLSVDGHPYAGAVVAGTSPAGLAVVNRVGFEDYVDGIAEMPSRWPAAALQAQAVSARTYALWEVLTHPPGPAGGQICATDSCQVYAGLAQQDGPTGGAWTAAVAATRGQVLLYGGRVIEALYGSSDGGATVSGGVPWLPAVGDPDDGVSPEHTWSWSAPVTSLGDLVGVPAGQVLVGLVSSPTAVTETLQAPDGSTTTTALDPDAFRQLLNTKMAPPGGLDRPLPSGRYTVSTDATTGTVSVSGTGDGNGLGLSQFGALGKAEKGWSADQILAAYYGPARPAVLAAGQMPTTIGVTLADGAGAVTVGADGPVRIEGPDGHELGTTAGPGTWRVTGGTVVEATPGAGTAMTSPPAQPATVPMTAPHPPAPSAVAPAADSAPVVMAATPVASGRLTSTSLSAALPRRQVTAFWCLVAVAVAALGAAGGAVVLVVRGQLAASRRRGPSASPRVFS